MITHILRKKTALLLRTFKQFGTHQDQVRGGGGSYSRLDSPRERRTDLAAAAGVLHDSSVSAGRRAASLLRLRIC